MTESPSLTVALGAVLFFAIAGDGNAQCRDWQGGFYSGGTSNAVRAQYVWDDGTGEALYVGGVFRTAGDQVVHRVAKWDGEEWSPLGNGVVLTTLGAANTRAFAAYDDGTGEQLYVGGEFDVIDGQVMTGIARWDGANWSQVGSGLQHGGNAEAFCLRVFDAGLGAGPELYVGGRFTSAGGVPGTAHVAKWSGAGWASVGGGMDGTVYDLCVHDDGTGPKLYAAGSFLDAGGQPANRIARYDGVSWSTFGFGVGADEEIYCLESHDDGSGPKLWAGGLFQNMDGSLSPRIGRWTGTAWQPAGAMHWDPFDMTVFQGELHVGGDLSIAGGVQVTGMAIWDGTFWRAMPVELDDGGVLSLTVWDDGSGAGERLYVGGTFTSAGGERMEHIATWDGSEWEGFPSGEGAKGWVHALEWFDDGSGGALYANTGHKPDDVADRVERWDGAAWTQVGPDMNGSVFTLGQWDDGGGNALYAAGDFTKVGVDPVDRIVRWDGAAWQPLPGGGPTTATSRVRDLVAHDDGSGEALYACGTFTEVGGVSAGRIARWDGASWSAVGSSGMDERIHDMELFDDGGGLALYACGTFTTADGVTANRVAKWDGTAWSPLGTGMDASVRALATFDDGTGLALYAGGKFELAGGVAAKHVAKWDGTSWSALGSGVDGFQAEVWAFAVRDDGEGPALWVAGDFTEAGGQSADNLAKWDGTDWTPGDGGTAKVVREMLAVDEGLGADTLWLGGEFDMVGGTVPSYYIARNAVLCGCPESYCTAGTTTNGCAAAVSGVGTPSASGASEFDIVIGGVEGQKQGLIFYGLNGPKAAPWGTSSSFLCVKSPTQRTGGQSSGGSVGLCDGTLTLDWNAYLAAHPSVLGAPFGAGQSVWTQAWFRDPPSPKTTHLSDAMHFVTCP